ncbi:hypothetical protein KKA14_05765, partial [bacterium]|nr:hypothetical protein [bacterium]
MSYFIRQLRKPTLFRVLVLWFITMSLIPLMVLSYLYDEKMYENSFDSVQSTLEVAAYNKSRRIQEFFQKNLEMLLIESHHEQSSSLLEKATVALEASEKSAQDYIRSRNWIDQIARNSTHYDFFLSTAGFSDVFLIDIKGNVLYTHNQENYLGINVFEGNHAISLLGKVSRLAFEKEKPVFSDVDKYSPTNSQITCFMATLVFS